IRRLYDEVMGPDWEETLDDVAQWRKIHDLPDEVLWETKQALKHRLISFARERTRQRHLRLGYPPQVWPVLEEGIFTIGFARRFATYKRATLLFRDPERLKYML